MKKINFKNPIFFVSPVLNRALGLEDVVSNFHIITTNFDPLIQILRNRGISVLCLAEELADISAIKNSFQVLNNPITEKFIQEKSKDKTPGILTFRSLPQIKKLCTDKKYIYLQSDPYVVRDIEDKVFFHKLLEKAEIKTLPTQICALENCNWLGEKSVLQMRHGHSGNSTFIFNTQDEFLNFRQKYGKHQVKYSPFISGQTVTLNGCITENTEFFGAPFIQITGISELTNKELGTCGNSHFFWSGLDSEEKNKFIELVDGVTKMLKEQGFRGFFGLDLIYDKDGNFWPIECNPRLTASVGNYTKAQLNRNDEPFLLTHLKYFFEEDTNAKNQLEDLKYSFIIFRNTSLEKRIVKNIFKTGRYKNLDNPKLLNQNIDFGTLKEDEFILLSCEKEQEIDSNREFLFLLSKEQLFIKNELSKSLKSFLKAVESLYWA